jgi:hypothetical protein
LQTCKKISVTEPTVESKNIGSAFLSPLQSVISQILSKIMRINKMFLPKFYAIVSISFSPSHHQLRQIKSQSDVNTALDEKIGEPSNPVGIDGHVHLVHSIHSDRLVHLVHLQMDNFCLFLCQQTKNDKLLFAR